MRHTWARWILVVPWFGCMVFDEELHNMQPVGECTTHAECTERLSRAGTDVPAACVQQPVAHCVPLLSEDCTVVTGNHLSERAIFIGSLLSTTGSQGSTNLARQESAALAVEQVNASGGVPSATGEPRPLVLVSCDEAANLTRSAQHLISELRVPAIIGPNTSQDTIDLTNTLSAAAGTALFTPTGVASSIANLQDNNLTFQMVPNDTQRAPLMIQQINDLESQLKGERGKTMVKLGVVYRNDALGVGTRTALSGLILNGADLSHSIEFGQAHIDPYDFTLPDQQAIVAAYLDYRPDIIVIAGTAEVITKFVMPLETAWPSNVPRPYYVGIDSVRVPELIAAVKDNDDLRKRIRGTGVTPGPVSAGVFNSFKVDYQVRYPNKPATISGMGSSYDAAFAIAYALAASKDRPVSGANISAGLAQLSGGATEILLSSTTVLAAYQQLAAGNAIAVQGTFGPFEWDSTGATAGGVLEVWCISAVGSAPSFQPSGLTYDIKTHAFAGTFTQCGP